MFIAYQKTVVTVDVYGKMYSLGLEGLRFGTIFMVLHGYVVVK